MVKKKTLIYTYTLLTIIIAVILFIVVRYKWYPSYYYSILDVSKMFIPIVVGLFLVGPIFSFIAYKEDQNSQRRDLFVIVALQFSALTIGVYKLHEIRPLFLVFSVDRFVVVSANNIYQEEISPLIQLKLSEVKPPIVVAAHLPSNPSVSFMMEVLRGAPDVEFRPSHYEPVIYQHEKIKSRGYSIERIRAKLPVLSDKMKLQGKYLDEKDLLGYPLVNPNYKDMLILFDVEELKPIDVIPISPWGLLSST